MSFKDQIRNWLACSFEDLWRVPPSKLLGAIGYLLFGLAFAAWRIYPFYHPELRGVERSLSAIITLVWLVFMGFGVFRRIRRLF